MSSLGAIRSQVTRPLRPLAVSVSQRFVPGNRAVVLMYHRITGLEFDPWRLGVAPDRFAEQMELVQRYFDVVPLSELADGLERGVVSSRTVAVTFDDGYRDLLYNAKPVLERLGVPGTVFVASGYVGSGRNFWWDALELICFSPNRPTKGQIGLEALGGDWAQESGELYMALWEQLHPLPDAPRRAVLEELAQAAGVDPDADPQTMTVDELTQLAAGDVVDIGGHTVTHPALADLPLDEQLEEMANSRTQLEAFIGRPVTSFCFPHGRYTQESLGLLPTAGYRQGCVSVRALVRPGAYRFEIPRWQATNLHADVFVWELARFFRGGG